VTPLQPNKYQEETHDAFEVDLCDRGLSASSDASLRGNCAAPDALGETPPSTGGNELEQIIVTAQRRNESMQDVPDSIQALTAQTLQQLNISTLTTIKFLPNSQRDNGRTERNLHPRLSAGSQAIRAVRRSAYAERRGLSRQSIGATAESNLDIYAADLNRIEVLEGPQGTLFEREPSGSYRYITNEPKLIVRKAT